MVGCLQELCLPFLYNSGCMTKQASDSSFHCQLLLSFVLCCLDNLCQSSCVPVLSDLTEIYCLRVMKRMPVIQQALLLCYWVLLCCEAATIATAGEENSTLHSPATEQTISNTTTQCSGVNDTLLQHLKQVRLATIRAEIMAKFGLTAPPPNPDPNNLPQINEALLATYREFINSPSKSPVSRDEDDCSSIRGRGSTFYARELRLLFPSSFHPVIPSIEMFEWGENIVHATSPYGHYNSIYTHVCGVCP